MQVGIDCSVLVAVGLSEGAVPKRLVEMTFRILMRRLPQEAVGSFDRGQWRCPGCPQRDDFNLRWHLRKGRRGLGRIDGLQFEGQDCRIHAPQHAISVPILWCIMRRGLQIERQSKESAGFSGISGQLRIAPEKPVAAGRPNAQGSSGLCSLSHRPHAAVWLICTFAKRGRTVARGRRLRHTEPARRKSARDGCQSPPMQKPDRVGPFASIGRDCASATARVCAPKRAPWRDPMLHR